MNHLLTEMVGVIGTKRFWSALDRVTGTENGGHRPEVVQQLLITGGHRLIKVLLCLWQG